MLQFAAGVTSDDTEPDASGEPDRDDDDAYSEGVGGRVDMNMEVDSEGEGEAKTNAGRVKSQHESQNFVDRGRCKVHEVLVADTLSLLPVL